METEVQANYTYMGRSLRELSIKDNSSSAFSDCNSDLSGEFPTVSSQSRRLLIDCASDNSDDLIQQLVSDLESSSIDEKKQAAMEIRLLAKNKPENRLKIGAHRRFRSHQASRQSAQERHINGEGKRRLRSASIIASRGEQNPDRTVRSDSLLVNLLETGNFRGKKDASTALYTLCAVKENKIRAVESGIMKPLVELMADFGSNMVDKSAFVLTVLVTIAEGRAALVEEGGIPVLVEIIEVGSERQKEIAVAILLQICDANLAYRTMVTREGAVPPLIALTVSGTSRAKQKAETLIALLRQTRSGDTAATTSDVLL
ncbi:ARM repeat superfamily protein [Actinidia rufa]|uniref:ARM repeat superfamily protein n=1 Tax=Actinidia rufa TaxID=165716 RepID=A0A7J0GH63_9ERIC|nr:ARM repeat superfamily protein [Actinidia rufa]